jgi:ubiquinone/menaquinone biosynthesis C-methylase UbiE
MLAMALVLLASTAAYAQEASSAHHCFQNASYWARVFEQPERAKWQKPDEVVQALGLKPGETVIDIGAGTGYFTRRFARAVAPNGRAIGVDIEPGMVAYMKADAKKLKVANYQAHLAQPDDPQVAPREADVIFFCDVLHHVDNRVAYLRKLTSALKPDGRIAVVDFQKTAPLGPPTAEKISQDEMIAEFKRAGYRLVGKHTFLPYQYFLEFAPESPSAQNKNGRGATEHGPSD